MTRRLLRLAVGLLLSSAAAVASAQIVLYERDDFRGRSFSAAEPVPNLDQTGFNDRAQSARVRGGRWQLCDDAGFRGRCVVLESGDYPSLRETGLDGRVSSVRGLDRGGDFRPGDRNERYAGRGDDRDERYSSRGGDRDERFPNRGGDRDGPSRAVLFTEQGLSGRSFVIDGPGIGDLKSSGVNDRVRSLRVEGGLWEFCSDSDFRGTCRTYRPGDYPSLPPGQDQTISSGRQISDNGGGQRRDR